MSSLTNPRVYSGSINACGVRVEGTVRATNESSQNASLSQPKENNMSEKNNKPTTKRALRAAKKLFVKQPHSTRPFTIKDYDRLPKS